MRADRSLLLEQIVGPRRSAAAPVLSVETPRCLRSPRDVGVVSAGAGDADGMASGTSASRRGRPVALAGAAAPHGRQGLLRYAARLLLLPRHLDRAAVRPPARRT